MLFKTSSLTVQSQNRDIDVTLPIRITVITEIRPRGIGNIERQKQNPWDSEKNVKTSSNQFSKLPIADKNSHLTAPALHGMAQLFILLRIPGPILLLSLDLPTKSLWLVAKNYSGETGNSSLSNFGMSKSTNITDIGDYFFYYQRRICF